MVYSGVDPSASSLHVGNLLPLLTLAHFARYNHTPIVLVGGATGSIGDPSGRSTERNALSPDTLESNVAGIQAQLTSFFRNVKEYYQQGAATPLGEVEMMNNLTWTKGLTLLDFLSSIGRHARITHMLARDSVASRLGGEGMSYTEFSYQLLQAYDFLQLHRSHSCTVQIGGSDQLGNITAGIDLVRRTNGGGLKEDPAYGLTLPLLTTSNGEKFGKSAGNAVWLDRSRTGDLEFYQFFLRSTDADVSRYLKALTLLSLEEVEGILDRHKGKEKERSAQRALADHITALIRGKETMEKCRMWTSVLFAQDKVAALSRLDANSLVKMEDDVLVKVGKDEAVGVDITKVLVRLGMVKSRGEAKRLVSGGGVYVNNRQILPDDGVREEDVVQGLCLVRAGKGAAVRVIHIT